MNVAGRLQKNGGNVASYFCDPDGDVIHAVSGPVSATALLAEAQWAVQAFASSAGDHEQLAALHREALGDRASQRRGSAEDRIHRLLADQRSPRIDNVYRTVFENIVGQRVSESTDSVSLVQNAVEEAKRRQLPMLFIVDRNKSGATVLDEWQSQFTQTDATGEKQLADLATSYIVVNVPLKDVPALSHELHLHPFAAPNAESPLFVITRSDARQLSAVTSWNHRDQLVSAMAQGLVQEFKEHRRSPDEWTRLHEVVAPINRSLGEQVLAQKRQSRPLSSKL